MKAKSDIASVGDLGYAIHMLIFRSLLFNILFYLGILICLIVALPCFVLPRRAICRVIATWARVNMMMMRVVVGTRVEFRGREHLPEGGLLVASKHQSFWETFALLPLFSDGVYVLKKELTRIPFFGWYALKAGMIPIDRSGTVSAIKEMMVKGKAAGDAGRQVIIFPEGTRRAPGAEPDYKAGTAYLYRRLGKPCLPVALNSGVFWPRRKFLRYPGTIIVEFLPPIPAGLKPEEFSNAMQEAIETASTRLWHEGMRERDRD